MKFKDYQSSLRILKQNVRKITDEKSSETPRFSSQGNQKPYIQLHDFVSRMKRTREAKFCSIQFNSIQFNLTVNR